LTRKAQLFVVGHAGYPFDVLVAVGASDEELFKAPGKKRAEPLTDEQRERLQMRGLGRTVMLPSGQTVLRLKTYTGTPNCIATLAHEVFHAVHFLMDRIGMRLSYDSDEAFAYATGNLTQRVIEGVMARKKGV